ncbi:MAG TPA: sulfite exporter TauE/SafE family protein [Acidiferrobacterales bacterium]|nr:sulfite exporter TauE/SafE family protein [Acidiferrobacterales bacterium]
MEWAYTLSGLGVGLLVGLTGVGGGSLMTPLLVLLFGFAPATAVGTDLLFASITKTVGVWVHGRRGTVDWKITLLLTAGSLPAAILTLMLLGEYNAKGGSIDKLVTPILGVALILTAVALLFKERLQRLGQKREVMASEAYKRRIALATIVTGAILGVLVTISSIGAGALGVVALFFLYPHLPAAKIVGSDLAHAVPLTAVAGLGHLHMGTVNLDLLFGLLLGSLPGIYLGSHLSASVPDKVLRPVLATMLLLIAGKFVL